MLIDDNHENHIDLALSPDGAQIVKPRISVRNLFLSRGTKSQFARVADFDACAGQSVALIGPSGAGKTTALMALSGIRQPSSGTVTIDGEDIWALSPRERDGVRGRRIGLVFQSFHLVDALSVAANIQLAAQCANHSIYEAGRLDMLLEKLDLSKIRHCRIDRISHGQAQRVAVARALLNRPSVILADEPTSALDDANASSLMELLKQCAISENAALVIATHDSKLLQNVDTVMKMEVLS